MRKKKPPIFQYLCLAVLFAVASAYQGRAILYAFPDYLHVSAPQWPFVPDYSNGQPHIDFVSVPARDAGAKEGDILVAVNARPLTGLAVFGEAMRLAKPGDLLTVDLLTPGEPAPRSASFRLEQRRSPGVAWALVTLLCVKAVMPVFCILLGFGVTLVRPRDPSAWLLFLSLLFFSVYFDAGNAGWGPGFRDLGQAYRVGVSATWPLFMLLFGLYFPEPFPGKESAWWRWTLRVVIPLFVADAVASVIVAVGEFENFASVARLSAVMEHLSKLSFLLTFGAVGSFFACIAARLSMAVTPDAKRRLRLLQWGTTISMAPACVLFVTQNIVGGELEKIFPVWLVLFSLALMVLFPVTLAYVIVVHRALDVRVVIRQGLQYALATSGIRVLQFLLTSAVVFTGITFARSNHLSPAREMTTIAILILAVLWLRKGAERLRKWTDRRFFRDAYNAEQILEALSDEVRSIVEKRPLLERVATKIAESLHIPRVAVLLAEGRSFRPAFAIGFPAPLEASLSDSGATVSRLKQAAGPERVYFDDENSWVNNSALSEDERRNLASLQPQLLLPLLTKQNLLGIISLGEKRSEAPYSGTDLRLLKSVASQTALALSNAELTSAIAVEIGHREKLNREIEIAREVQERLFPQRLPEIAGLDYFGRCRTALGVGGDYYDFLALPEGKLGVALGDVSGKGIAAALTMASLQASLRADAMRAGNDLAGLITRVNAMLYDASTEDRYATLFYAQYDPATHRLSYVNAGHCPPILLRSAGMHGAVERLDQAGGTVVGLLPECVYEQAEVSLARGDLLVIYTDGFSEAMNPDLAEWGEQRLTEAITACNGRPARDSITRIMQAADAFAAGTPQSDDMTLVILRAV
jgi:sigma-B regulation protein RsbU (phosphoserine phosphatase)